MTDRVVEIEGRPGEGTARRNDVLAALENGPGDHEGKQEATDEAEEGVETPGADLPEAGGDLIIQSSLAAERAEEEQIDLPVA